jgi:hypothetical protein
MAAHPFELLDSGRVPDTVQALMHPELGPVLHGHRPDAVCHLFRLCGLDEFSAGDLAGYFEHVLVQDPCHTAQGAAVATYFGRHAQNVPVIGQGPDLKALAQTIVMVATGETPTRHFPEQSQQHAILHDATAVARICEHAAMARATPHPRHHADFTTLVRTMTPRTAAGRSLIVPLCVAASKRIGPAMRQADLQGMWKPVAVKPPSATALFDQGGIRREARHTGLQAKGPDWIQ